MRSLYRGFRPPPMGFALLTSARQSETLRGNRKLWVGVMMRIVTVALSAALAGLLLTDAPAQAQTAPGAPAAQPTPTDMSSQQRRALRRVPIYPRDTWRPDVYPQYFPGPNAVRVCNAHYVQEYRPSGTVITPRMHCHWRPG